MAQTVLAWLSQMIMEPFTKPSRILALIGLKGCDKSLLIGLIARLIGMVKVFSTTNLRRDACVYGHVDRWIERGGVLLHLGALHASDRRALKNLRSHTVWHPHVLVTLTDAQSLLVLGDALNEHVVQIQCGYAKVVDDAYLQGLYGLVARPDTMRTVWAHLKGTSPWARLRTKLAARAIVVYWLSLTEKLMAPGGTAAIRDRLEFEAENKRVLKLP